MLKTGRRGNPFCKVSRRAQKARRDEQDRALAMDGASLESQQLGQPVHTRGRREGDSDSGWR